MTINEIAKATGIPVEHLTTLTLKELSKLENAIIEVRQAQHLLNLQIILATAKLK